jgi:hypothetical protein
MARTALEVSTDGSGRSKPAKNEKEPNKQGAETQAQTATLNQN